MNYDKFCYRLKVSQSCGLKTKCVDTTNQDYDTEQMTEGEALEENRHDFEFQTGDC